MAAAGCFFSVVLAEDGRLFTAGNNTNGCLADGSRAHHSRFLRVEPGGTRFRAVVAGLQHVLALDERGGLWAWGSNFHGQLGLGARREALRPARVRLSLRGPDAALARPRVHALAAGLAHCLLSAAAPGAGGLRVFAAGCNSEGQLGTGDLAPRRTFAPVVADFAPAPGAAALAAGGWHSHAVDAAGRLWTWGALVGTPPLAAPDGTLARARTPVPCALDARVFGGERVCAVAAGHCHTLALTASGVWSHGDANRGCLGHPPPAPPGVAPARALPAPIAALAGLAVESVACGPYHNLAVARGRVFAWGCNSRGQLGLGDLADRAVPTLVPPRAFDHQRVAEVAAGVEHGCALTLHGTLYTFGRARAR
ncbi:MAG: hypothetical protein EBR51_06815, partial [Gammaproteobacteria bacterium]|nr:hypothetical protein [Gammaproteobacteria bacterium]